MKKIPFILLFSLSIGATYGQDWVAMMQNPNVNVRDVQKAFYLWYAENRKDGKENGSKGEDGPVELFKRWENYMVPRTYPSGVRPNMVTVANDYEKYKKSNNSAHSAMGTANWTYAGNTTEPTPNSNGYDWGDGRVNRLRFFPGNSSVIFACTPGGGLWESANGGTSWTTNTDNLGDLAVSDIAINPKKTNTMYIGTGDNDEWYDECTTIGVLKSTDGGNTWNATGLKYTVSYSGPYGMVVNQLQINPDSTNIIWAATSFGLWKSADSGVTWKNIINDNIKSIEFEPFHSSTIYAGNDAGEIFVSTNRGNSFTTTLSLSAAARMAIGVSPADSNRVYVLAENSSSSDFYGLYMSTDNGKTFNLQSSSPNLLGYSNSGNDSTGNGWYTLSLGVSATNADTLFVGGVNIWMSGDKGVDWQLNAQWTGSGAPYVHADIHQLTFVPGSGSTLYATCDAGVFKSYDKGNSWTDYSNNLEIGQLYSIGVSALTPGFFITGWQDNGTNLSMPPWTQIWGADGEVCFIDYTNDNNLFFSIDDGVLYSSTDKGVSFNQIGTGITENGPWTTRWLQDPVNSSMLYAGFVNVWQSSNMGSSWTPISAWGTSSISALAVSPSNNQYIYAAQYDSIFVSANQGSAWKNINGSLPFSQVSLTAIAIDPTNPLKAWVTFSGYTAADKVYETTNGGGSWTNMSSGLPNLPVNTIAYQPGTADGIYVGTDEGIYYHDTVLNKWVSYSTGLPNTVIDDIKIPAYNTNTVVTATYGRGVWQSQTYTVGIPQLTSTNCINLFPNPATNKVNIIANVAKEGIYTISIVNMLGQMVYNNNIKITGRYTGSIDLSAYSKGIYLFSLKGNNTAVEKKIVVE